MKSLKDMTRDEVLDLAYDSLNKRWEDGDNVENGFVSLYDDEDMSLVAEVEVKNESSSRPRRGWTPAESVQRAKVFVKTLKDEYSGIGVAVNEVFEFEDIWQER